MKREILVNMLRAQFELNKNTNGAIWVLGRTKHGKLINWGRSLFLEVAELIESYPHKHWKDIDMEPDMLNVSIEIVDGWHFIMSGVIEYCFFKYFFDHMNFNGRKNTIEIDINDQEIIDLWETRILDNCVELIEGSVQYQEDLSKDIKEIVDSAEGIDKELAPFEELMLLSLNLSRVNSFKDFDRRELLSLIVAAFNIITTEYVELDLETLYHGKSILNQFRQDNGYKNKEYVKIWDTNEAGKELEDNVFMFELIIDKDCSLDCLYEELDNLYKELVKK